MHERGLTHVLHCLLNRGTASHADTMFFANVKHDELIDRLRAYLNAHRHFLGNCQIEQTQALNDKGVDLLLESGGKKFGFQVKSHFDVSENKFSQKVKAQFTEALSFGLTHFYVLFCCAMTKVGKDDLSMKVTHLRNDLGLCRNVKFTLYTPQITAHIFNNPPQLTRPDLLLTEALSDDALDSHELGYEHLPDFKDEEIEAAEKELDRFGDEWFDSKDGQTAFDAYTETVHRKLGQQFTSQYLPTIPVEMKERREYLVKHISSLLVACRACKSWDDRSELKLTTWIEHVPEEMIPFTSLPNLLLIRDSMLDYLAVHQSMANEVAEA